LKTKTPSRGQAFWQVLTEVPGWPDAPVSARVRRALPVVLPLIALFVLAVWRWNSLEAQLQAYRAETRPLLALENEVFRLENSVSPEAVAELNERAVVASRLLVKTPEEITALMTGLKNEAEARGFDATWTVGESEENEDGVVTFTPVRGKLTAKPNIADPFNGLLAMLDRLQAAGKRIDLMRLSVRVDEQKWRPVEVNLRLAQPKEHEKASQ
jgi:hypothetical protein